MTNLDFCPFHPTQPLDAFGQCTACENDLSEPDVEALLFAIAQTDKEIAVFQDDIKRLREDRSHLEEQVLARAQKSGQGTEAYGYRTRWTAGRAVVTWDVERVVKALPDDLKPAVVSYTPNISTTVLTSLEKAGKLPDVVLDARTIKPAEGRYVLEKVKA